MSRPINNKKSKLLIRGLRLIYILIVGFTPAPLFANFQIDSSDIASLLSSWSKSAVNYADEKFQQKSELSTDLFGDNAKNYNIKKRSSMLNAIQDTQNFLVEQYASCSLSSQEISTMLFFSNPAFAKELRRNLPSQQYPKENEYTRLCNKLTSCIEGTPSNNLNKSCESIINEPYLLAQQSHDQQLQIEESNLKKDRYQNGNEADSAFDLLVDMGKIGKIFFQEIKNAPEILFYRLPNFKTGTSKGAAGKTQEGAEGNNIKINSGTSTSGGTVPGTSYTWTSGGNFQDSTSPVTLTEDIEIERFIQEHSRFSDTKESSAFVNYCVVGSRLIEEAYTLAQEKPSHPLELSHEEINSYIKDILDHSSELKQSSIHTPLSGSISQGSNNLPPNEKSQVVDEVKKQLESCVEKCDSLAFDERAICKLQCLCAEYISPKLLQDAKFHFIEEGALRARICTIPSKPTLVQTKTKTLYSIEEILKEIQDVIDGLYDSGELTTKTRVNEMLDTSQKKFNFSKNFSFIIGLGSKTPTTNSSEKQLQESEIQFLDKIRQNRTPSDERNRYSIVENYTAIKNQRSIKDTETPSKVKLPITTATTLSQDKINTTNYLVSEFLDQNILLLYKMNESFKNIDQALQALWQKKK